MNMNQYLSQITPKFANILNLPNGDGLTALIIVALMLWVMPWKGVALWKAVKLDQKKWFVILLVVNTLAILEIIYIFAIARKKEKAASV